MARVLKRMRPLLGTFVEVGIEDTGKNAERDFQCAFEAIALVNQLLSYHDRNSDLSRLNNCRGSEIVLHPISVKVLKLARAMTCLSSSLFNLTVGGKMEQLGILPKHSTDAVCEFGSYRDIEIRKQNVRLNPCVRITLDGIAKGFAVDLAVEALKRQSVSSGWVNAGGDLRVFGKIDLPVQRRELDGQIVDFGILREAALATSVYSDHASAEYPGQIVSSSKNSNFDPAIWTVIAKTAWRADALTKVAALAPSAERRQLIEKLGGRLAERKRA